MQALGAISPPPYRSAGKGKRIAEKAFGSERNYAPGKRKNFNMRIAAWFMIRF
jgi:hypothetical protein